MLNSKVNPQTFQQQQKFSAALIILGASVLQVFLGYVHYYGENMFRIHLCLPYKTLHLPTRSTCS